MKPQYVDQIPKAVKVLYYKFSNAKHTRASNAKHTHSRSVASYIYMYTEQYLLNEMYTNNS